MNYQETEEELSRVIPIKSDAGLAHIDNPLNELQQAPAKKQEVALDVGVNEEVKQPLNKRQDKRISKQAIEIAYLQVENKRLFEQLARLKNKLNHQTIDLAESQQREKQLNANLAMNRLHKEEGVDTSIEPIHRIKTAIEQQPDLLKANSINGDESPEQVAISSQVLSEEDHVETALTNIAEVNAFTGAIEFGFSYEQDNQVTRSLKGRLILDYDKVDRYNLNSDLKFEFESEDGDRSTDKFRWQLQSDWNLDPVNLIFARSDMQRSQFSSYKQEDIFAIGYGRIFFNDNNHKFNTEIGPGYKSSVPNDTKKAVSVDEFILRTRLNYERIVSENLQLTLEGVFEMGHSNSVYSVEFRAQNRIYRQLYLTFDVNYKYYQNVPVETVNQEVSTGFNIMYAF